MSKIQKTSESIKRKLSFDDYSPSKQEENTISATPPSQAAQPSKTTARKLKDKITAYVDDSIVDMFNELQYNRAKARIKESGSDIICKAIELLYDHEKKNGIK